MNAPCERAAKTPSQNGRQDSPQPSPELVKEKPNIVAVARVYRGHPYRIVHTDEGWRGEIIYNLTRTTQTKPFPTVKEADGAAVRCIQDLINGTHD